jgi:hypothetical protein
VRVILPAAVLVVACRSSAPPTPLPPEDPDKAATARVERIAQACTKIASCAHSHDAPRERDPGACVDWWIDHVYGENNDFATCIARARSCAEVDHCARDRGDPQAVAFCKAHPDAQTGCDGTRLVTCGDDDPDESTAIDCAKLGATCGEQHLAGGLVTRACLSPQLCPPGAPEARCDGKTAIISCHEGAVERSSCPAGVPCQEHKDSDGDQTATCEPPGHVHCEHVGERRCDGSRLVQCVPHGHFGEPRVLDCAAFGLGCGHANVGGTTKPDCIVPNQAACDESGVKCDGQAVSFCAAGRKVTISCAALGFGPCDPDAKGLDAACKSR